MAEMSRVCSTRVNKHKILVEKLHVENPMNTESWMGMW